MSAEDFGVVAIVVPNPQFDPDVADAVLVNASIGFLYENPSITTLSSNNPGNMDKIEGLLYAPQFATGSMCYNDTSHYVPRNVTSLSDFRGANYPPIAIAPFTTLVCNQEYLAQMRQDDAKGAIFFHPDGKSTTPPSADDASWEMHDDGAWLTTTPFPIYALPGSVGAYMMHSLALYSGNLTAAPYGAELAQQYDVRDFVRLWATIPVTNNTSGIPSLWVFLIIVLAILLCVVLITSFIMHLVQNRHRRSLQRRVANGEVDLEALGIKRLNVPQDVLDKMPQYVYTSKDAPSSPSAGGTQSASTTVPSASTTPKKVVQFSQPTCPICLDDFTSGETTIRELPCNHIYHPECIDPFLVGSSSLCPVCKRSTLPPGYCPVQVTNLMVRRERLLRRMRERAQVVQGDEELTGMQSRRRRVSDALTRHFGPQPLNESVMMQRPSTSAAAGAALRRGIPLPGIATGDAPVARRESEPGTELEPVPAVARPLGEGDEAEFVPPPEVARQGTAARRAWRRDRVASRQVSMYDRQARAADEQVESKWKRLWSKLFPSS